MRQVYINVNSVKGKGPGDNKKFFIVILNCELGDAF